MNGLDALDGDRIPPGLDEQRQTVPPGISRASLARIVSNEDYGAYTITEQRWDPAGEQWQDAFTPLGYVGANARDYRDRSSGEVDQLVRFWERRDLGGEMTLLLDVGERLKVSANDSSPGDLADKLVGDDGAGNNIKVSLTELNDGADEKLKIEIAKDDIPSNSGIEVNVCHRIRIPDGSSSGTYTFSTADWRGRVLTCRLQVVYDNSPNSVQWGGGATSGLTRYFGSAYSGSNRSLVYVTGGKPAVVIEGGTGHLFWSWDVNNSGLDLNAICVIQANGTKTSPDYTV